MYKTLVEDMREIMDGLNQYSNDGDSSDGPSLADTEEILRNRLKAKGHSEAAIDFEIAKKRGEIETTSIDVEF